MNQPKAKIFLADQRGLNETASFRSMHTFNFGKYFNEYKHPFGDIYVFNDEILAGGASMKILADEYCHIILLPVTGAIIYNDTAGNKSCIAAGQAQVLTLSKSIVMEISNPFKNDLVNFLQIRVKAGKTQPPATLQVATYADVNKNINNLVAAFTESNDITALPFAVSIGKFSGRGESIYKFKNKNNGLFIFVIEGAFETEGRLLHARDALALWETTEAAMEALSNDAIILTIELSYAGAD